MSRKILNLNSDNALLLIIDIQEKLIKAMQSDIQEMIIKNTGILIEAAKLYNIPILITEQYRKGLGSTVPVLSDKAVHSLCFEKIHFDCTKEEAIGESIKKSGRSIVILAGMENHVCVFQTALSLLKTGFDVLIASDAVSSQRKHDWDMANREMSNAGAYIYPTETIAFLLLERAGTDAFKQMAPLFR